MATRKVSALDAALSSKIILWGPKRAEKFV
jgi:hypothetical protein